MIVNVAINSGIVDGENKRFIEELIPENYIRFTRRKQYDEYYWETINGWLLDVEVLEKLVSRFLTVELYNRTLMIKDS
jgi:hypothetical protein